MKSHHPINRLATWLATLCLTLALLPMASCGPRDDEKPSWLSFGRGEEKSFGRDTFTSLGDRFGDLKERRTGNDDHTQSDPDWPFTAVLLLAVAGFALIGGASLGSRARKGKEHRS